MPPAGNRACGNKENRKAAMLAAVQIRPALSSLGGAPLKQRRVRIGNDVKVVEQDADVEDLDHLIGAFAQLESTAHFAQAALQADQFGEKDAVHALGRPRAKAYGDARTT